MSTSQQNTSDRDRSLSVLLRTITAEVGVVPRRSGRIAGFVACVALLSIGLAGGVLPSAIGGGIVGVAVAVSIPIAGTGQLLRSTAGGVFLLGAISAAVGLPASYLVGGDQIAAGISVAGVLVGLGLTRFRIDAVGDGAVARAIGWLLRVSIVLGLVTLFAIVVRLDFSYLATGPGPRGIGELIAPTTETGTVAGFVVVSWFAFAGIWIVTAALPPAAVLPESSRSQYLSIQSRAVSTAGKLLGIGSIIVVMVYVIGLETAVGGGSIESTVGTLIESPVVRGALLRLFLGGLLVTVLLFVGRSAGVAALVGGVSWSQSGIAAAGGLLGVVVVGAAPAVGLVASMSVVPGQPLGSVTAVIGPTATGLAGGVLSIAAIGLGLTVLPVASGVGLLPTETAGPRLVVGGLLVAVLTGASAGVSVAVFGGVVAAVIVWDVAAFGIGLTSDLGPTPAHRDGELVHAAASLLVGGLTVAGTVGVQWLLTGVRVHQDGLVVTAVLAVVAMLVVSTLLRG